ncbi:hypothetical protein TNCV_1978441 [Trichonephila clavipes]|nr:hypothetical protein TNCV_1978441 [Trichonephila clavipes]
MRNGKFQKPQEDFDLITKDLESYKNHMEHQKGQLLSLGSCPISNCQFHINLNAAQIIKQNEEEALKLQYFLANSISNVKNKVNNINKTDEVKNKKTSRVEGFTSPTKVAKKQKILQNYSVGVDAPVNVQNKFNALAGSSAMPDSVNAAVPVAPKPPKIPFIHLKFQNNYNLIMQEITRKWPKSKSKLSGEYLKILASTADEHREITAFLKEKGEEFHAIDPIEVRPQKVVIKGLPISTDIDAIRADLTEWGFNKEVSFAKAVKNDKQMAPPLDKSEPAQSKPEVTPNPLKKIEIAITQRPTSPKTSVLWTR